MFMLEQLEVNEIREDAIHIMKVLDKALDHSVMAGLTTFDILQFAVSDPTNNHIWKVVGNGGVAVAYGHTRSIHYPNYSAIQIVTLANVSDTDVTWEDYRDTIQELEYTARENNYMKVEVVGRFGWRKRLAQEDYNFDYAVFSKNLGGNND